MTDEQLNEQFNALRQAVGAIDGKVDALADRIGNLEAGQRAVAHAIGDMRRTMMAQFDYVIREIHRVEDGREREPAPGTDTSVIPIAEPGGRRVVVHD